MMSNEISTKLYYIDYSYIIKHYREPTLWQKRWEIYNYGKLKIVLGMRSIDVIRNRINMGLCIEYKGDKKHHYSSLKNDGTAPLYYPWEKAQFDIPISHEEYTNVHFQNALYGCVKGTLLSMEQDLIANIAPYKAERTRLENLKVLLEDTAKDFLDEEDVSNDAIRKAYIDAYVDDNYSERTLRDILDDFKEKILIYEFLLWASFNNQEDDIKKYSKIANGKKISKSCIKSWLRAQQDQNIEWIKLCEPIN